MNVSIWGLKTVTTIPTTIAAMMTAGAEALPASLFVPNHRLCNRAYALLDESSAAVIRTVKSDSQVFIDFPIHPSGYI